MSVVHRKNAVTSVESLAKWDAFQQAMSDPNVFTQLEQKIDASILENQPEKKVIPLTSNPLPKRKDVLPITAEDYLKAIEKFKGDENFHLLLHPNFMYVNNPELIKTTYNCEEKQYTNTQKRIKFIEDWNATDDDGRRKMCKEKLLLFGKHTPVASLGNVKILPS